MIASVLFALAAMATVGSGYHIESAGAPPSELDASVSAVLQKEGVRITHGEKTVMELWFIHEAPKGPENTEANISITTVPHGALMGVARFPDKGTDRLGQTVKPGLYTMRMSFFPPDGNHQGVSEQRDFLVLSLAASDKDAKAAPEYPALMEMSKAASGTPHPLVFSVWKADAGSFKAGVEKDGEHDQVLHHMVGDLPLAMIIAGTFGH